MSTDVDVKEVVRARYGEAATRVAQGTSSSCCGGTPASVGGSDPITSNLYDALQAGEVPEKAMLASLGCGNPTALAELKAGETVLDLGRAAASTCCCRPSASDPRDGPSVWT